MNRWLPAILALVAVAPLVPAQAALSSSEVVYVRQKTVNKLPYPEMYRQPVTSSAAKMFGGCLGTSARYCGYADPVVSPDATRLAFVFEAVGETSCRTIWIAGLDGRGARQATLNGCAARTPSWSPDGSKLAFEQGGEIYEVDLCRATLPERNPRRVTSGKEPSYSRDGRWIAFARGGDVWKIRTTGSSETNLTQSGSGEWSPRWAKPVSSGSVTEVIAFVSDRDGPGDVYVMDPNGGGLARKTRTATFKDSLDVAQLPAAFAWQEGDNVMFAAGTQAPRVLAAGYGADFGLAPPKRITTCP